MFASGIVGHLSDDSFLPPFAHAIGYLAKKPSFSRLQQRVICVGYPGMVEGSSGDGGRGREGPSPPPQVPSKGTWRLVVEGGGSAAAPPSLTTTPQPTARRNASISALSCTNAAEMYADHHD